MNKTKLNDLREERLWTQLAQELDGNYNDLKRLRTYLKRDQSLFLRLTEEQVFKLPVKAQSFKKQIWKLVSLKG